MMAVVAVGDVLAGPGVGYLPLLSLGPAFASLSARVRRTAAVGALALVLYAVLAQYDNLLGTRNSNLTFVPIVGVVAASMLATVYRVRHERELADVRTVAQVAQRVLLRPVPRRVGPIRATVRYVSAAAQATIGGDLYEVVMTPNGVRVIVGDVQGKGLEAVETAAVVLGAFREAAYDEPDLPGLAARIEKALARHLTSEKFVTAVLAEVQGNVVTLLNRGHPPPLLIRSDKISESLDASEPAPPLGLGDFTAVPVPAQCRTFAPGDQILFYTDGITEARNKKGAFYPLTERTEILDAADPEAALDDLQDDLTRFVGAPLTDDAALLLLRHRSR
ncbi:serine/threonine-protein phosphatase [Actinomadura sp. KC216]|uniref:PP2C family protein-serine/threonine phosphatase n=1 Tax=Actinomadura sp. KC216 TaxID=2530370 RepID=UPI00104F13C2|nr:PP2C family protein-serine/threonine phosphatase [Actinomadura sp. KC216]TDB88958.1 serine/threonine-protein phosphatase [Actinomadura sp. KC216]